VSETSRYSFWLIAAGLLVSCSDSKTDDLRAGLCTPNAELIAGRDHRPIRIAE